MNDLDQKLTEEVLNQLAVEDTLAEEFLYLSLDAISGTNNKECIKLKSLVTLVLLWRASWTISKWT
jgi:hypothetical protein